MAINDAWFTCDGAGHTAPGQRRGGADQPGFALTRRGLLAGVGAGALTLFGAHSALAQIAVDPMRRRTGGNVLVVLFQRGGADGLSLVVPHFEDAYYRARPTLALRSEETVMLDDRFGLHPSLRAFEEPFRSGQLAVLHAVGSQDDTRSHFEAMSAMERGLARDGDGPATGWIARHLAVTERPDDSPLRAIAIGHTLPDSLRGATHAAVMANLGEYRLDLESEKDRQELSRQLAEMYRVGDDEMARAGRETLDVLRTLEGLDTGGSAVKYPESPLGEGLRQVATLIRADVGLEVACLDQGGWDTHVTQGSKDGWLPNLAGDLANTLAAFQRDLGGEMRRVTVVVMTEFGRRLAENSGLGTDHGHGGAMFLLGAGVRGGKVYADWPGLSLDKLTGPGDLQATTDYRDVLGQLLAKRLGNGQVARVFDRPLGAGPAILA